MDGLNLFGLIGTAARTGHAALALDAASGAGQPIPNAAVMPLPVVQEPAAPMSGLELSRQPASEEVVVDHRSWHQRQLDAENRGLLEAAAARFAANVAPNPQFLQQHDLEFLQQQALPPVVPAMGNPALVAELLAEEKENDGPQVNKWRHLLCSHGKRASTCTTCFGRLICWHGRQEHACRECAEANKKTLARDKKCPICTQLMRHCRARGCKKVRKYQRKAK